MDTLAGMARKWVGGRATSWGWRINGAQTCEGHAKGWEGA